MVFGANMTSISTATNRSARDDYAEARRRLVEHEGKLRDLAGRADVAGAERDLAAATARLEAYPLEAARAGERTTEEGYAERAEAERQAAQKVRDARDAEATYLTLAQQRPALLEARKRAKAAVLREVGLQLAEERRQLVRAAERAEAGVQALIDWGLWSENEPGLSIALREALKPLPSPTADDPGRFDRAKRQREADLGAFRDAVAALPERLESDPTAAAPSPEDSR